MRQMRVVFDSSVLIDHLRGDPRATSLMETRALQGDELWSVTPVRTEILAGMRPSEATSTLALFEALVWQDVTIEIADQAGDMARRYLRSHPGVDTIDYLVAAATALLDGQLLTQNVKHFPMMPHLRPAYP